MKIKKKKYAFQSKKSERNPLKRPKRFHKNKISQKTTLRNYTKFTINIL